jgi:hypothetical protein
VCVHMRDGGKVGECLCLHVVRWAVCVCARQCSSLVNVRGLIDMETI